MEQIENRPEYHDVIAKVDISIMENLAKGNVKEAVKLLQYQLTMVYTISRSNDIKKGVEPEDSKEIEKIHNELNALYKMIKIESSLEPEILHLSVVVNYYKDKIGATPMQTHHSQARVFNRLTSSGML